MGWAGPAQPIGPDSAQNCWADFGPKWVGPISAQKKTKHYLLGQTRPRRQGWARIHLTQAKTGRGEIIFPPTPACRTLLVLHAGNETRKK